MPESEDRGIAVMRGAVANDNPGSESLGSGPGQAGASGGAEGWIDSVVVTLAPLICRRIAREELDRLDAANDNAPGKDAGEK